MYVVNCPYQLPRCIGFFSLFIFWRLVHEHWIWRLHFMTWMDWLISHCSSDLWCLECETALARITEWQSEKKRKKISNLEFKIHKFETTCFIGIVKHCKIQHNRALRFDRTSTGSDSYRRVPNFACQTRHLQFLKEIYRIRSISMCSEFWWSVEWWMISNERLPWRE